MLAARSRVTRSGTRSQSDAWSIRVSTATSAAKARNNCVGKATRRLITTAIGSQRTLPTAATPSTLVVREEFALRVPDGLDLAQAAPLLCAGITTYSPLRTWNIGPGGRVGVIGLGGLG